MMEEEKQIEPSIYLVALYAILSFVCVMVIVLFLYVTCSRKYRLNWFEKNLIENADTKELTHSCETLIHDSLPGSSNLYPDTNEENKFWVPNTIQKQSSNANDENSNGDDSPPSSPILNNSGAVPIARNDKQIVLSTNAPLRPKVASMHSKLDHTKIDSALYQQESPVEDKHVRGSIHVSLIYDPIAGILTVRLIEAQDLQAHDFSGTADPYAKIRLLPDKNNVWQTKIHKKTLNPVFDEDFVFEVRPATLGKHSLEVLLYDFDAYSRHQNIGGIHIPLSNIDLSEKVDLWKALEPCAGRDTRTDSGELMVSLAYLPSAERLTAVIVKARNLRVVDDTRNSSDPYIKAILIQGGKKVKKKKTAVHRNTICPVFNEALTFDVSKHTLNKCHVEFNVMHDSLLGTSESLGFCRVGTTPDCRQNEKEFFADVLHSKTAIAQWLPLTDVQTST